MLRNNIVNSTTLLEVKLVREKPDREATSDASIVVIAVCITTAILAIFLLFAIDAWKHPKKKASTAQSINLIPCRNCRFFKESQYLKCAVHPSTVLTKQAINCLDYQPSESHS